MPAEKFDWKNFEKVLTDAAYQAALQVMNKNSKKSFYSVAFHEFYREQGDVITLPCLAANTVEDLDGDDSSKWSSPDWRWVEIRYANPQLTALHKALQKDATRDEFDDTHWEAVEKRCIDTFVNVSRSLTRQLKKHPAASSDFGVFFFDEENEDVIQIVRRCTTASAFKKLFPNLQKVLDDESAPRTAKDRFAQYKQDVWSHSAKILKLGEQAIPMLLEVLNDPEQAWRAAGLLGELGVPQPRVIAALRSRCTRKSELAFHDTGALALLGDVDFVVKLAANPSTREAAIRGLTYYYSFGADESQHYIPLDYKPIEQVLADKQCKPKVTDLSTRTIKVEDIDEALRGLESPHAVIRKHAMRLLGEPRLGKKEAQRILPALVKRLQDKVADVRRRAILAVVDWKSAAKPYAADIRRLFNDPDADVRSTARHYIKQLQK